MDKSEINQLLKKLSQKEVVIMCGLPGSGKSYFASKLDKEYGYSYLSTDVIRFSKVYKNQAKYLKKSSDYLKTRELVYSLLHQALLKRVRNGKKVVVDATYLGPQRNVLLTLLNEYDLLGKSIMAVVKVDKRIIKSRIGNKKLENGQPYLEGWQRAYDWFAAELTKGNIRYPNQKKDKVKVLEIWNDS